MYKLCDSITFRVVEEKALAINLQTGEATAFDEIGTLFFTLLKENGAPASIVQHFQNNYIVDDKILYEDVNKFLKYMVDKKIFEDV